MKVVILIPARYASNRYPGKPLAMLRDASGVSKTLVERCWEAACRVSGVSEVYVATDDDRIAAVVEGFSAKVIMTAPERENGTARCAEAITNAGLDADLIINLQGDAPLTPPWFVEAIITRMSDDPTIEVATPVVRFDAETYDHFVADRKAGRVGGTTVVLGANDRALYFSKEVIPYIDTAKHPDAWKHVFHHVGLYGYRPAALKKYATFTQGPLEMLEGLEQLRFLENGVPVTCIEVDDRGSVFWELNNPEDVERIESYLIRR